MNCKDDRFSKFSKKRAALYKKASELVRECGVDLGIVISSPTGKSHSFMHPTTEAIVHRFMNPSTELSAAERFLAAYGRKSVNRMNDKLNELDKREEIAKEKIRYLDRLNKTRVKGWWESIDQISEDDILKYNAWLTSADFMMEYQLKQLENGPRPIRITDPCDQTLSGTTHIVGA